MKTIRAHFNLRPRIFNPVIKLYFYAFLKEKNFLSSSETTGYHILSNCLCQSKALDSSIRRSLAVATFPLIASFLYLVG